MRSYLAAFALALVLAAVLTPLVRVVALRLGAVSRPGGRNVNEREVPRLGGVAIAASVLAPLVALFFVESGVAVSVRDNLDRAIALLAGGLLLCVVGAIDDVWGVRASYKLAGQAVAAAIAFHFGFRIEGVELPLLGTWSMGVFALPVTLLWIIGVTNAVNLIDGLDGLAAGVVFFAAVTNFVVALFGYQNTGQVMAALLMASLMGALIGFLFYNFNPARIFMGDSGSYFLGYLLATSSMLAPMQKASTTVALLVPMVALGVPIFDTLLSMLRRYLDRRPLFSADRGHMHHRLLDMGITHRRAVLTLYGVSVALAGAATAIALGRDWSVGFALVGASAVLVGLVRFLGYFQLAHTRHRRQARIYEPQVQKLIALVPQTLDGLRHLDEREGLEQALTHFAQQAGFSCVTLEQDGEATPVWTSGGTNSTAGSVARFRTAPGRRLCFFRDSRPALPPEAEVLVQLVVERCTEVDRAAQLHWLTTEDAAAQELPAQSSGKPALAHRG